MKHVLRIALIFLFIPFNNKASNFSRPDSSKCLSRFDTLTKREVYILAGSMPQFPGGMKAMLDFISKNLNYPRYSNCYNFTVFVSFIVEVDGRLTNKKVLNVSIDPAITEALKMLDKMPEWKPGFFDGTPVPVKYHIPIRFKFG